jgi:inorganic pyrophosphatase
MDSAENIEKMTPEERKYVGLHMQPQSYIQDFLVNPDNYYVNVDVFIEIAKNSHIKYEYDKERKALVCDRILHTPLNYQFNYGFIPNTLSEDGDPIDAVVVMEDEIVPGCYINCKIIGVLETKDDAGVDPKLILLPSDKIDPVWAAYDNINELSKSTKDKIKYFFQHYKDLENKKVEIGEFKDREAAIKLYKESIERYNNFTLLKVEKRENKITNYFAPLA